MLNRIFVKRTGADARHEQSPDARIGDPVHAEAVATPLVEIAFNPDVGRVRRPDREAHAVDRVDVADGELQHAAADREMHAQVIDAQQSAISR